MKKLFLFSFTAFALSAGAQRFQLGAKGGVNVSNFNGGDFSTIKKEALVGFHAGGYIRFRLGGFSLQPEVLFSTQGAKLQQTTAKQDYKIRYVNVPVMFQYIFRNGFYLEAGPQVGFKTSENIPNTTIGHFAKNTDLAIDGGLGFQSKAGIGIGARYIAGLSKVGDFNVNNFNPNFHNGVFQASLFLTLFGNRRP